MQARAQDPPPAAPSPAGPRGSGHWEGALQAPTADVSITVDLARGYTGQWAGSMSIPAANAVDLPLSKIAVDATMVRFTAADLPGSPVFTGSFAADGSVSGTATNGNAPLKFTMKVAGEAAVKLAPRSSPLTKEFEGDWAGAMDDGTGKAVRFALQLSRATDGTAAGRVISVDQGGQVIPLTTISIKETKLEFEARALSATYTGVLNAKGVIEGTWVQSSKEYPLDFQRDTGLSKK